MQIKLEYIIRSLYFSKATLDKTTKSVLFRLFTNFPTGSLVIISFWLLLSGVATRPFGASCILNLCELRHPQEQVIYTNNSSVITTSRQTKLATLITNFFDVQHGHEAMQDLNDLWSEFMDSKQFKQASDIRKSNLLATVQHVGTFLCKLEVLTLKNEIV